jgi:hypothetical protein
MHDELYTDGIGEITVSGAVVRVDLVSLSPTERDESGAPKSVFRQRLIFTLEGFANSVELIQKAFQGLLDAGAVRRTPRPQPTIVPVPSPEVELPSPASEPARIANVSPNFS